MCRVGAASNERDRRFSLGLFSSCCLCLGPIDGGCFRERKRVHCDTSFIHSCHIKQHAAIATSSRPDDRVASMDMQQTPEWIALRAPAAQDGDNQSITHTFAVAQGREIEDGEG